MGYSSLRKFLIRLEKEDQLVHLYDEIDPEPDIRVISRAALEIDSGPAVMLHNLKGYRGKRIVLNVHGSWENLALSFDMEKNTAIRDQFKELCHRWNDYPGELEYVSNPECQQNIIKDKINLFNILPLYRINKYDGGFYLSKGSVITADPNDKENINTGIYRIQIQGPDTIGIQALPFHDIGVHIRKAEEKNEPLPITIAVGVNPVLSFISSTPIDYNQSEYKYSAALNGTPEKLASGVTSGLPIPAEAEYIIEGQIIPRKRFPEGAFGEFPGSYSGVRNQVRMKVKAVTHRDDAIFENLYNGRPWTEMDYLEALNTSVPLYHQLNETMPEVEAVNAFYQHGLTVIVAMDNKFGGYAKSVAFRLASTPHGISYCKNIILVDSDIDPFNLNKVMWALSTRVRPGKDVTVITNTPGQPLDPASDPPGMSGKVIIDATTPVKPDKVMKDIKMIGKVTDQEKEKFNYYRKVLTDIKREEG